MIKNLFLLTIAAIVYAIWQAKGIIFVLSLLLLGGCNAMETTCHYDAYGDHYCTKTYYFDSAPQPSPVYVVEEKEAEDTIILIEKWDDDHYPYHQTVFSTTPYCGDAAKALSPYPWQPEDCYLFVDGNWQCDWISDTGYRGPICYEAYLWDDWECEWYYMFDWCDV